MYISTLELRVLINHTEQQNRQILLPYWETIKLKGKNLD